MRGRSRLPRADLLCLLFLALVSIGFLWRCTLAGRAMLPGDLLLIMEPWRHHASQFPEFQRVSNPILDAVQQFYPWRRFAGESLRAGTIPLWNPYELCGNPFVGNNQSAVLYPETWLHALIPTERALAWATSLYFFLSGALMYWFLRVLGLVRPACLLGALAFMFNGFHVGWECFPSFRSVPGWLPGMLVCLELAVRSRRAGWVSLGALFCALQFLAGNLHISLYVLMAFIAYGAFRFVAQWRASDRTGAWWAAGAIAGTLAAGTALAATQLLPTLELVGMSSRAAGGTYPALLLNALAPQSLLTALMPDVLGNPVDYNHWGATLGKVYRAYTESAFYVGVAPVLLFPFAFRRWRAQAWFWAAVALIGALLAVGTHLNAALYYLVPVFRALTGIGRAVILLSTGLAVGGALGLDALLRATSQDRAQTVAEVTRAALTLGLTGVVAGMWVWMVTGQYETQLPGLGSYTMLQIGRFALFLTMAAIGVACLGRSRRFGMALLLGSLAVDLYLFVDHFTPAVRPEYLHIPTKTVSALRSAPDSPRILSLGRDPIHRMAPNTPMLWDLLDIQGSDSLEVGPYRALLTRASTDTLGFPQPDPSLPLVDLLGTRFIHCSEPLPGIPGLRLLFSDEGYLYENLQALPRAFVARASQDVTPDEAMGRVASPGFRPAEVALLTEAPPAPRSGSRPRPVRPDAPLTYDSRGPNAILLRGSFRPGQVVVVSDSYYPGWRAFQGRRELPILRADYALRALRPEAQSSEIRLLYIPGSFQVGAFLSLLTAALLAGVAVASRALAGRRA